MSSLLYGNVFLEELLLLGMEVKPVQVGFQYAWSQISVSVEGRLNPGLNSYVFGQNPNAPLRAPGYPGPVTEMAIRNSLAQPRGQFILEAYGLAVIISPPAIQPSSPVYASQVAQTARAGNAAVGAAPGGLAGGAGAALQAIAGLLRGVSTAVNFKPGAQFVAADCNNGPVCSGFAVTESVGDKTFRVALTITTWISEIPIQPKPAPPAPSLITATRRSLSGGQFAPERPLGMGNRPDPGGGLPGILPPDPAAQQNVLAGFDGQDPILRPANPAPTYFPVSPLAAHEWGMRHIVDQDFYTTRIIDGRAVFRRDVLLANKLVPDQLRYWLGHPVPWGMRRIRVEVFQLPDGITYEYRVIDRDRALTFDPNMFSRVEAAWTITVTNKGLEDLLFPGGQFSRAGAVAAGVDLAGRGILALFQGVRALLGGERGVLDDAISGLISRPLLGAVPLTQYLVLGRFWAHPEKQFTYLERQAWEWLVSSMGEVVNMNAGPTVGGVQLATTSRRVTRDVAGTFCEIEWRCGSSILSGGLAVFQQAEQQRFLGNAVRRQVEQRPIYPDPMRGTYVGACVAQALRNPGDAWVQPQDPPLVRDRDQVGGRLFRVDDLAGVTTP